MLTGFVVIDDEDVSDDVRTLADEKAGSSGDVQIFGSTSMATKKFTSDVYGSDVATDKVNGIAARNLSPGLYYFNEKEGSQNGQLMTGRTVVDEDGETFYYYFNKSGNQNTSADYGRVLTSTVKDGYLYGKSGRCLTADDGNTYAVYRVADIGEGEKYYLNSTDEKDDTEQLNCIKIASKTGEASIITIDPPTGDDVNVEEAYVVVSQSGRIKQSGTATIDGVRYRIRDYKVYNTEAID